MPTFLEQGYALYNGSARGLVGPKGMPEEAIKILSEAIVKACQDPGFVEKSAGMSLPLECMGREEYGEYLQQAYKDIGELWKRSPWRK